MQLSWIPPNALLLRLTVHWQPEQRVKIRAKTPRGNQTCCCLQRCEKNPPGQLEASARGGSAVSFPHKFGGFYLGAIFFWPR